MANQEHLDILKQGVDIWNAWKNKNSKRTSIDLSGANLSKTFLHHADLSYINLSGANLAGANLAGANLNNTNLNNADLSGTDLAGANLTEGWLIGTDLSGANLSLADLSRVLVQATIFGNIDLRLVKGLETIDHRGPSTIGIDTVLRSEGDIPEIFLRKAGVSDTFIDYIRALSQNPIQYYTCFISYSSKDQAFAERLHADLQSKGVRCWFASEDLKIGDKIRPSIDESIHLYDKLLLVLSQYSVASQWVEQEVETALEKERKENRTILFPIRLDNAVMDIEGGWPVLIRNTRNMGDFTCWKDHDAYQKGFERLLRDLKAEA